MAAMKIEMVYKFIITTAREKICFSWLVLHPRKEKIRTNSPYLMRLYLVSSKNA